MTFQTLLEQWWGVFSSWALTPTGALLTLLLIGSGGAAWILRGLGRSARIITWVAGAVAVVWMLWILGGVLGRMGAPIRQILAWLPAIVDAAGGLLVRLLGAAG